MRMTAQKSRKSDISLFFNHLCEVQGELLCAHRLWRDVAHQVGNQAARMQHEMFRTMGKSEVINGFVPDAHVINGDFMRAADALMAPIIAEEEKITRYPISMYKMGRLDLHCYPSVVSVKNIKKMDKLKRQIRAVIPQLVNLRYEGEEKLFERSGLANVP